MLKHVNCLFYTMILFWGICGFAEAAIEKPSFIMCKNKKIIRTVRVEPTMDPKGCITTYTKAGIDRVVGTGIHIRSCVNFLNNIKTNLEKANWNCRDISTAKVSAETGE